MAPREGKSATVLNPADRERERQKYKARIANAINEEDDPLAAYHQFVQWTMKNYRTDDATSGLTALLEEATEQFKDDTVYKTDLRYLKLWALRARLLDRLGALNLYARLVENEIGTTYSALYEDYAGMLEESNRQTDAEAIFQRGIARSARPLARLKTRYQEFQDRRASASKPASTSSPSSYALPTSTFNSTAAQRYALMLAPPAAGKRPEKFRFNLALLWTDEGGEYSIQEARARSMGLLGKKWGPPPPSEVSRSSISSASSSSSSSSMVPVDFNDDGHKSSRLKAGRRSLLGGTEPTVTINTKEALADVFGMYNSPEKTFKLAPGSKHAPIKKIEPVTPIVAPRLNIVRSENQNTENAHAKTPTASLRPFRDENSQPAITPANSKITPFIDPEQRKTPFTTPRPPLGLKDPTAPTPTAKLGENAPRILAKPPSEDRPAEPVFSKVFTPASKLRDVFTADHGLPPRPKPLSHERAKSLHDVSSALQEDGPRNVFTPFQDENAKTPFKVFSRPGEEKASVFTPKTPGVFSVFQDSKPAITPFKDNTPAPVRKPFMEREMKAENHPMPESIFQPPPDRYVEEPDEEEPAEEEGEQYEDEQYNDDFDPEEDGHFEEEDSHFEEYEEPLAPEQVPEEYDEGESFHQEAPLGGRFGQFNVMTPITERTFEFTSSHRATPTDGHGYTGRSDIQALEAAAQLAAELQDDEGEEEITGGRPGIVPLQFEATDIPQPVDLEVEIVEERTGSLSLLDTLTLGSKFRPSNPCNPFDNAILTNLLSRIPADPYFYDLRQEQANHLVDLQKHAKKSRKASSGSSGGLDGRYSLTLNGQRFLVSDKLGEGGFGTVFKAKDMGEQIGGEDEDEDDDLADDDDDEAVSSMVALKVVKPRNLWEYHVLKRLHSALPSHLRRSVVLPHALYAFADESYLVLDFCSQGMLLTIVNNAVSAGVAQAGACLDELLVMFFTIELLRLIEGIHSSGFIHGDLKIDNCLLRLEDVPGGAAAWSPMYQPSGEGGWSYKGLKVIDFGRTIDTRLFPQGQSFIADWATDERDCFEIRENRPWTYQTDYFGLAGIVYCMLFGKYIQNSSIATIEEEDGTRRCKIATPFKRYWQTELWNQLFDVLLNPCLVHPNGELPVCDALGEIRQEMEMWLQANCNRTSNTLKGLLKKVELSCY